MVVLVAIIIAGEFVLQGLWLPLVLMTVLFSGQKAQKVGCSARGLNVGEERSWDFQVLRPYQGFHFCMRSLLRSLGFFPPSFPSVPFIPSVLISSFLESFLMNLPATPKIKQKQSQNCPQMSLIWTFFLSTSRNVSDLPACFFAGFDALVLLGFEGALTASRI